jgi:ATP-dependent DNA ligase
MLARPADDIPRGEGWLYEPKWDGFRAITFVDGEDIRIASRTGQPLERYFSELIPRIRVALPQRCVVDGEIVLPSPTGLDFDMLGQRVHPAASRVAQLARSHPTTLVIFDLLAVDDRDLREERLDARRRSLVDALRPDPQLALTPQTDDADLAATWFTRFEGAGLDGVVAKRADQRYRSGERVMVKVKHQRTADCVVGGYRVASADGLPGSLLLGLYDSDGILHHVGNTTQFSAADRRRIRDLLAPYEGGESFGHGRTPGGPSRWTRGRDVANWKPLRPELVCEVAFDHMQRDRFRHHARLLRWRPDRDPRSCTYDQLVPAEPFDLGEVLSMAAR